MTLPTSRYTVTERAGPRVAGRRVRPGEVIELTATEAEHEQRLGAVVPEGGQLPAAFAASDKAAALRAEAAAFRAAGETRTAPASVAVSVEAAAKPAQAPRKRTAPTPEG